MIRARPRQSFPLRTEECVIPEWALASAFPLLTAAGMFFDCPTIGDRTTVNSAFFGMALAALRNLGTTSQRASERCR